MFRVRGRGHGRCRASLDRARTQLQRQASWPGGGGDGPKPQAFGPAWVWRGLLAEMTGAAVRHVRERKSSSAVEFGLRGWVTCRGRSTKVGHTPGASRPSCGFAQNTSWPATAGRKRGFTCLCARAIPWRACARTAQFGGGDCASFARELVETCWSAGTCMAGMESAICNDLAGQAAARAGMAACACRSRTRRNGS